MVRRRGCRAPAPPASSPVRPIFRPMSDLHRLFSLIVTNIAATDASRLHAPMTIGDLMQRIAPYRSSRRHLDVVTSEEYELLVLRLAAGEEGLARLEPP